MTRLIDLTGKEFGLLTVLGQSTTRVRGVLSWDCLCECGNTKVIAGPDLRRGDTNSCGCSSYKREPKDITGVKRGSLTAVENTGVKCKNGDYIWKFRCDCGRFYEKPIGTFNYRGDKQSCGECSKITRKLNSEKRKTHGFHRNHKTYKAWCKIKERCYNPRSEDYHHYGAKGIAIDDIFKNDFLAFYAELGEAPNDGQRWSVDRIDHTKGYLKGNIRWATDYQQARNKGKMCNNTTGVTGVSWDNKLHLSGKNSTTYAVVQWKEYDTQGTKIPCKKCFSTKKYGLLEAFALAVKHRRYIIKSLNERGYGYAENHGQ